MLMSLRYKCSGCKQSTIVLVGLITISFAAMLVSVIHLFCGITSRTPTGYIEAMCQVNSIFLETNLCDKILEQKCFSPIWGVAYELYGEIKIAMIRSSKNYTSESVAFEIGDRYQVSSSRLNKIAIFFCSLIMIILVGLGKIIWLLLNGRNQTELQIWTYYAGVAWSLVLPLLFGL